MLTIIDTLKQKVIDSEELVKETRKMYLELKQIVKIKELELKRAKSNYNRSNKNWIRARKLLDKSKRKMATYSCYKRRWAKNHMDKVLELIER